MQVTVGASFFKKMEQLEQKTNSLVEEKAKEIVSTVVDLSPVDTGAFVSSWSVNARGDRTRRARSSRGKTRLQTGAKESVRQSEKARLLSEVSSFDFSEITGFTVTNTAPHLRYVEENPHLKTGFRPSEIVAVVRNLFG